MPTEWIIVLVVGLLLLFSAKKLPDMARGLGQSMRIFKAETRGLREDDQTHRTTPDQRPADRALEQGAQGTSSRAADDGVRTDTTVEGPTEAQRTTPPSAS